MKVAILTTFADLDMSYSLCGVAVEQAAMCLENGVDFSFFVLEEKACNNKSIDEHDWLKPHVRKEVPSAKLEEDVIDETLVRRTSEWLETIVAEHDVLITHDWMFITWNVSYNAAVREVAEKHPEVTWVHWVHSAPSERPSRLMGPAELRYTASPYSLYVYLNEEDRLRYAESIGIDIGRVMVCYNPSDVANFLGCDQKTAEFVRKHRLWDHDLMQVYPLSMPRATSKGLEKVVGIFGAWKQLGYRVKLVIVNAHSNAQREKSSVQAYRDMGYHDWGLTQSDLIFTSLENGWDYSVPHSTVKKLLHLSNVFVFPTHSEACSRVLQEASLAGCFVIGNSSFKPMKEFLHPSVPTHAFCSARETVNYSPSFNQWIREVARATTPLLQHPMIRQKSQAMRMFSRETVWREQFLPILEKARQMAEVRS